MFPTLSSVVGGEEEVDEEEEPAGPNGFGRLWGPLSWGREEGCNGALLQRETDAVELWVCGVLYGRWAATKRALLNASEMSGVIDRRTFEREISAFAAASGADATDAQHEVKHLASTAAHAGKGRVQLLSLFQAVDAPWSDKDSSWTGWLHALATTEHRALSTSLYDTHIGGGHGTDECGALLPEDEFWDVIEAYGLSIPAPYKRVLLARYGDRRGSFVRIDAFCEAIAAPVTISDVVLYKELLGTVTHRVSRALLEQVQSIPFPPRRLLEMVSTGYVTPPNSPANVDCPFSPVRTDRPCFPEAKWTAFQRMPHNSFLQNVCKGDVLVAPARYGCPHRSAQDEYLSKLAGHCGELDKAGTEHITCDEFRTVLVTKMADTLPSLAYILTVLSIVYNDTHTRGNLNYVSLLRDIDLAESAYPRLSPEDFDGESDPDTCSAIVALMYRKWVTRGFPSLVAGLDVRRLPEDEFFALLRKKLNISVEPSYLASILAWQITAPCPHPPRLHSLFLEDPPETPQKLRARIAAPPPLIVSVKHAQTMLESLHNAVVPVFCA